MKRRSFLNSAWQTALAVDAIVGEKEAVQTERCQPEVAPPSGLMGEAALSGYFSEQRLHEAVGTAKLEAPSDVTVIAFNFPSWHASPYMQSIMGKNWTEYTTLKNAQQLFDGHSMPHFPLWGYYDESQPSWAEREIELASSFGVDGWMIDWYWHSGLQFYHEQLESGFLKAANRNKLKFAIMWANHDWKNVYPADSPDSARLLLPQLHSYDDFAQVAEYCAEKYFKQPNYLAISGAPVFGLFDVEKVITQLGEAGLRRCLRLFRERAQKSGVPRVHLQVCNPSERYHQRFGDYGFDSATLYGTFAWTYGFKPNGSRIPYGVGAAEAVSIWNEKRRRLKIPFFPTCSVGWDDSPRFGRYSAVAINRSPDQFERLVRAARHFCGRGLGPKAIYIGAWNEWTEDSVLLPDSYWGYSYLEALQRAARSS